jgi:hypothetical protein
MRRSVRPEAMARSRPAGRADAERVAAEQVRGECDPQANRGPGAEGAIADVPGDGAVSPDRGGGRRGHRKRQTGHRHHRARAPSHRRRHFRLTASTRRGAGVVERARLEIVCALTRTEGSNPSLSAPGPNSRFRAHHSAFPDGGLFLFCGRGKARCYGTAVTV